MTSKAHMLWTFAVTSIALFMVTLDSLVVTTALPVIRRELNAIQGLGGAIVMPLTLTILSEAVPPERRGVALGAWAAFAASPSRPAEVHEPASSRVL